MNIILLGPPGAGKGTVAGKIKDEFGFLHLSTGDMLRAEIGKGTELGLKAKALIDKGMLVPDDVIIGMVSNVIAANEGIMFDGFPRTLAQAETLDTLTKIDAVIALDVDEDVVTERICSRRICPKCKNVYSTATYASELCECGEKLVTRADDNEQTARERFRVYRTSTLPLEQHYEKRGVLHKINADCAPDEVAANVRKVLEDIK